MIVVKEKDPKLARQRLEDEFTNIHAGSLIYSDGKKLGKPQPGYPKIKSTIDGVEHGMRFQTRYTLMYPWRGSVDLHDSMFALAHSIENIVHERTSGSKVPHPYPRGHLYTQPELPDIYVDRSSEWPNSINRVGVFWDFSDCLVANDGDVLLKLSSECFRYQMAQMRPMTLFKQPGERADMNYITLGYRTSLRMPENDIVNKVAPEADRCAHCNSVLVGLKFTDVDSGNVQCIGCRCMSTRLYSVYEMTNAAIEYAKSVAAAPEYAEALADMRIAERKKLQCGAVCYVGDKYIFAEAAHQLIYGPPIDEIPADKKIISVTILKAKKL